MGSKTDDVIQELVAKFNRLVAFSSDLQVQLTVREDEKDKLKTENENLLTRSECCKKIAKALEVSNRARMESERRALLAERELVNLKEQILVLENQNRKHENRLATINDGCSVNRDTNCERYHVRARAECPP